VPNGNQRPLGFKLHVVRAPRVPVRGGGTRSLTNAELKKILLRSMDQAADGYPLPRGMRIEIEWQNGGKGEWRRGEWSEEMSDSLTGRTGSTGWETLIRQIIEAEL
jgi:hypothetical protein